MRSGLDFTTILGEDPRGHHRQAQYPLGGPTYYVFGRTGYRTRQAYPTEFTDSVHSAQYTVEFWHTIA